MHLVAFCLLILPSGYCDIYSQRLDADALAAHVGKAGSEFMQQGDIESARRAFQLAGRLQPSLWQAHYSLGTSLLTMCRCSRALVAYSRAMSLLRQQGRSAHDQATVLKALASSALPIAKTATNSSYQLKMLEFVAATLEDAFALQPEAASPLYGAVLRARGRGGLYNLLLLSSSDACCSSLRAQAADALSRGQTSKAVMLSNRARQLNPDRRENFRILREAIQAHAAERKHLPRPLYMPRPGMSQESFTFFSQNGQDQFIFEHIIEPHLKSDGHAFRGVFLEAGAVDGVVNSNTLFFEHYLGWTGVLIEPSPIAYRDISSNRPFSRALNMAVGGLHAEGEDHFVYGKGKNALCEQRGGLVRMLGDEGLGKLRKDCDVVESVSIQSRPLGRVLEEEKMTEIDLLSLDLEGSELSALQSINWEKVNIKILCVENNEKNEDSHENNGASRVAELLYSKGYRLVASIAQDDIFSKL